MFADALPHVPEHRRLPVLVQLVETLDPARFLWVLMLLLFKLHATHTASAASEKVTGLHSNSKRSQICKHTCWSVQDAAVEKDVDFWISLCSQFEVGEQVASLNRILGFLLQLPEDKDEGGMNTVTLAFLCHEIETAFVRSCSVCSCIEVRHRPASNPEEEGGAGGEDGGADLQRGGSQQQRAATFQVHQRVLHGPAARLSQLHREGERSNGI